MWDHLHRGHEARLPTRTSPERLTIILLIVLGLALLMVGRTDPHVFDGLKTRLSEALAPALEAVAGPVRKVRHWRQSLDHLSTVYRDNERLRAENEALRAEVEEARRSRRLVERYQALLDVEIDPEIRYRTVRIIGDSGGPFARSVLVNAGGEGGIEKNQGVIDNRGLVGRVVSVGPRAARVLLLTDISSRVPVVLESTGSHAAVAGDGSAQPVLAYLPEGEAPKDGERIVTSGVAGVLPPGLLVGTVARRDGERIRVALAADMARLDYLRVLDFDVATLAEPPAAPAIDPSHGPSHRDPAAATPSAAAPAAMAPAAAPLAGAQVGAGGQAGAATRAAAADALVGAPQPRGVE